MKKISYLLLGLAGLTLASCSQDDMPGGVADGEGNVLINVTLPADLATRALYGEGTQPKQLQYAVFEENSDGSYTNVISSYQNIGTDMNATLKLNLLSNKKYQIAFFAQSESAASGQVYIFDPTNQEIKVNYSNMGSQQNNGDAYDCFYANLSTGTLSANNSATFNVTMTRPVAQINWGTSDLDSNQQMATTYGDGGNITQTFLTIKGAPTSFNMITGEMSSDTEDVTFPGFAVPGANTPGFDFTYPINPEVYKYLAIQYVLTSSTSNVYDITLNVRNNFNGGSGDVDKNINLTGAPLQANYRTNVYGNLLSSEADINITITPDWGGSSDITSTWDGQSSTTPATSGNYTFIEKASDLAGLADMVSNGTDFSGKTVVLVNDFDLNGYPFPGIGVATRSGSSTGSDTKPFRGTFDGNGHTISGLSIKYEGNVKDAVTAFIPNLDGTGVLQNVVFENVTISGGFSEQVGIIGLVTNGAKVSNVTVNSGTITGQAATAGIVGRMMYEGTIEGCTNRATITGTQQNIGGIVGAAYYTKIGSTMTISNCKNYGAVSSTSESSVATGGIAGLSAANVSNCYNYASITGNQNSAGGIVGNQKSAGSVTYCYNEGTVTCASSKATLGMGGIVGWADYDTGTNYGLIQVLNISYNTNKGNVVGKNGVAGIVGYWTNSGICENNTNEATSLKGTQNVAGIVGYVNTAANYGTAGETRDLLIKGNTSTTSTAQMEGTPTAMYYNGTAADGSQSAN